MKFRFDKMLHSRNKGKGDKDTGDPRYLLCGGPTETLAHTMLRSPEYLLRSEFFLTLWASLVAISSEPVRAYLRDRLDWMMASPDSSENGSADLLDARRRRPYTV